MAEIKYLCKAGKLKIGTMFKVAPLAPLNKLYHHVGIVTNIKDYGFEILHLKKGIFIKYAERVFINFNHNKNNYIFNFDRGVEFIFNNLTEIEIKYLYCRMEELLLQPHIPYGLKSKHAYNCESLALYALKGEKISYQVLNFQKKFGIIGYVAVSTFDKVMIITNIIGFIICYFENKNK